MPSFPVVLVLAVRVRPRTALADVRAIRPASHVRVAVMLAMLVPFSALGCVAGDEDESGDAVGT